MNIIVGIESTCDETAIAIIKESESGIVEILSNIISSQQEEHEEYGGVVPELAARSHLNNIKLVAEKAFNKAHLNKTAIDAVAASYAPGLIGGLLVGNLFGKTIASVLKKPFIAINHLEAHILMPLMNNREINYPFLALLVSGGHTQIILVRDFNNYEVIGKTLDDSLGETFDKVALTLGMKYPGGPLIEKAALSGDSQSFKFPMPLCGPEYKNDTNFSFSGLKTHIKLLVSKNNLNSKLISDISATFQYTISQILINRISNAIKNYDLKIEDIVISGGVSANKYLRNELTQYFNKYNLHFPSNNLSTDNGVMIAWNGLLKYKRNYFDTLDSQILARVW